jgi:hypothetical protein
MSVAAKISVTILNDIFVVCMCSMIPALLDICICALSGNAEFLHSFLKKSIGPGLLVASGRGEIFVRHNHRAAILVASIVAAGVSLATLLNRRTPYGDNRDPA